MAHAAGTVHKDLRLGEILFGSVHPQAEGISLAVDHAEALAPQLRADVGHVRQPVLLSAHGFVKSWLGLAVGAAHHWNRMSPWYPGCGRHNQG